MTSAWAEAGTTTSSACPCPGLAQRNRPRAMLQVGLPAAWTPNIFKGAEGPSRYSWPASKRGFEEHPGLRPLVPGSVTVLLDLVRRWFYDVSFGINATEWWLVLTPLPTPDAARQVSAFRQGSRRIASSPRWQSRTHLARILTRYAHLLLVVKEVRTRFDDEHYGPFRPAA